MLTEEELLNKRTQLIEHVGVYMEKEENFAPVAARIYATLILMCSQGMTFDQLVTSLGASKSTVWTHLNMLENNERIDYFTKPGDRKRYYRITSNRLMLFIDDRIARCETDLQIQKKIIAFKQEANEVWKEEPEKQCDLQFNRNIQTFLNEAGAAFKRLKVNLTENQ